MVRKTVLLSVLLILCMAGAAAAADGVRVLVGYTAAGETWRQGYYFNDPNEGWNRGDFFAHGPSVNASFMAGNVFLRGMFDYQMGTSANLTNAASGTFPAHQRKLTAEVNVGYRVYKKGNLSATPYIGAGFFDWKATNKTVANDYVKYVTPYGVAGLNFDFDMQKGSVGFDIAALVPFSGNITISEQPKHKTMVGLGARVMVPCTYNIVEKKPGVPAIMLFATPFFEYLNSFKTKAAPHGGLDSVKYNFSDSNYGIKAGVGFAF